MDIICDLDGTLANIDHRLGYVRTSPKNYKAFEEAIPYDSLNKKVFYIVNSLVSRGSKLIFVSGRSEKSRSDTEKWLRKMGFSPLKDANDCDGIIYDKLYMREAGDFRSDDIIKMEILNQIRNDGYDPQLSIDDRISVCKAWAKAGIFTVCVNQGLIDF